MYAIFKPRFFSPLERPISDLLEKSISWKWAYGISQQNGFSQQNHHRPTTVTKSESKFSLLEKKIKIDNIDINYAQVGNGSCVVLCLPGAFGTIQTDFEPIISRMNLDKFKLVCWDPPGYGKSRPPNRIMGKNPQATDATIISKLMGEIGFEKYSILGWSNGGATGVHIAAFEPHKIHKFIAWGAPAFASEASAKLAKMMLNPSNWDQARRKAYVDVYGETCFIEMTKDTVAYVQRIAEEKTFQIKLLLPRIQASTLIIHGQHDVNCPIDHAYAYRDGIANSKMEIWPNSTHYLHLEHPEKFVERIETFLIRGN